MAPRNLINQHNQTAQTVDRVFGGVHTFKIGNLSRLSRKSMVRLPMTILILDGATTCETRFCLPIIDRIIPDHTP